MSIDKLNIDKQKALRKWSPILDNLDVKDDRRREIIAIFAEYRNLPKEPINFSPWSPVAGSNIGSPIAAISTEPLSWQVQQ